MSAFLRAPQIVPSRFSHDQDRDDAYPGASPAQCIAALSKRARRHVKSAAVSHIPAVAAYSGLLILFGKPLLRVAALAMGASVTP